MAGKHEAVAAKPKRRTKAQIEADTAAGIAPPRARKAAAPKAAPADGDASATAQPAAAAADLAGVRVHHCDLGCF